MDKLTSDFPQDFAEQKNKISSASREVALIVSQAALRSMRENAEINDTDRFFLFSTLNRQPVKLTQEEELPASAIGPGVGFKQQECLLQMFETLEQALDAAGNFFSQAEVEHLRQHLNDVSESLKHAWPDLMRKIKDEGPKDMTFDHLVSKMIVISEKFEEERAVTPRLFPESSASAVAAGGQPRLPGL